MNGKKTGQQHTRTAIATAVAILMMGAVEQAEAQSAAPADDTPAVVVVKGVRAALEQSLRQKRSADAVADVVTAEDIGKTRDKNVADAIQRLPGVNTQICVRGGSAMLR